jgi:hypothetical protein
MRVSVVTLLSALGLVVAGCGGGDDSSIADASTQDSTKPPVDGGTKDATEDTTTDTSSTTETGPADSSSETATTEGGVDGAADAGACTKDCTACCEKLSPKGAKELLAAELACACTTLEKDAGGATSPTLCGPVDGGPPDASAVGEGACSAAACGGTATASKDCTTCLRDATGTKKAPAKCYDSVETACSAEADCVDYAACVTACEK